MAAVVNETVTEKRATASAVQRTSPVYVRTVTFPLTDGGTAGTANLTGFTVPKNTLVMGGAVKFSVDQGATATFKFSLTSDGDISTAVAYNSTAWKALNVVLPKVATDDRVVTYTTAAAAVTACTVTLTLVLCPIGVPEATYTTYSS